MRRTTEINKILIMHPCIFTYDGLCQLFMKKLPGVAIVHVTSVQDMIFYEELYNVDLIVSELYGLNENIIMGTRLLSFVQSVRQEKPLLIMTDLPGSQALNCLELIPMASFIALSEEIEQLVNHVEQVLDGNVIISPSLSSEQGYRAFNADVKLFSQAEVKVYNLLQEGFSISQIAKKISRSIKTVSAHKRKMMAKLGVDSEVELYACFNQ